MSEEINAPTRPFTPVKAGTPSAQSSALTDLPDFPTPGAGPEAARAEHENNAFCFVELPRISSEEKAKYEAIEVSDYESDADEVVELVGERKSGDKLYLFAIHKDGVVRRVRNDFPRVCAIILNKAFRKKLGNTKLATLTYMRRTVGRYFLHHAYSGLMVITSQEEGRRFS